jgi:GR25 family glycosyltransferase involved in LPS biosynthesis
LQKLFDHIYCINLDRRADRWRDAQLKFIEVELNNVKRFSATDGKSLALPFGETYKAEVATFMSHLAVIKDAQSSTFNSILIFEDDVVFAQDFKSKFIELTDNLPLDWDLIYWGGNNKKAPVSLDPNFVRITHTVALHAYSVSRKCYAYLIAYLEWRLHQILASKVQFKPNVAVDEAIAYLQPKLNMYAPNQYIVFQLQGFSDIQQQEINYDQLLSGNSKTEKGYSFLEKIKHQLQFKRQNSLLNKLLFAMKGLDQKPAQERINVIIFSKDRAFQLDALLQSITLFAPIFDKINILYKASDEEYKKGYEVLKLKHPSINWVSEQSFKPDLCNKCMDLKSKFTCFLVDDNVFYKPVPVSKSEILQLMDRETACFSLRLGFNCTYSHPSDKHFKLKSYTKPTRETLQWIWATEEVDFNYPLSLDGHIFKTDTLFSLLKKTEFKNPNSLEDRLQKHKKSMQKHMRSFDRSVLLGMPVNKVNTSYENRFGTSFFYMERDLNDKFLKGERMDLSKMDFDVVNGCHYETAFFFKSDPKILS